MKNEAIKIQSKVFNNYFNNEDITFIGNTSNKSYEKEDELKRVEEKKEKVIKKIAEDKKKLANDPRALREYINNSESVLESIEIVYDNIIEILNIYRNISKNFILISEKFELKLEEYNFKQDIEILSKLVENAKDLEVSIESDNKKNYLIIDSFLDKKLQYNYNNIYKKIDFSDLTLDNLKDNMTLKIFDKRVELPYTKNEIEGFLKTYPDNYKTVQDVISQEFMMNISLFNKHPILSRFKETYYLCRTKEMMSIFDSFSYAKGIMFRSDINSYIIAATKSKKQLEDYIYCLDNNKLSEYSHFKIIFNINPLAV